MNRKGVKSCLALVLVLWFLSSPISADIYSWTDEKGVKHFSNEPPSAGETVRQDPELKHDAVQYEKWQEARERQQTQMLPKGRSAAKTVKKSQSHGGGATLNPGNVMMFTTPTCGYCIRAKKFFSDNRISYTELDITKDKKAKQRFTEFKGSGVPLIIVGNRRIAGFNKSLLSKLFGISTAKP